jgi:ribose-phosphate pyrophosphokinase
MLIVSEQSNSDFAHRLSKALNFEHFLINIFQFPNGEFFFTNTIKIPKVSYIIFIFPKDQDLNISIIKFVLIVKLFKNIVYATAIIPYFPYARQNLIIVIIQILKACNIKTIITFDIHFSGVIHNINDINIINILPHEVFKEAVVNIEDPIFVAPDLGAIERVQKFAEALNFTAVFWNKKSPNSAKLPIVKGRNCIIVDDIIDSGKTIDLTTKFLQIAGGKEIFAVVSHCINSNAVTISKSNLNKFYTSESMPITLQSRNLTVFQLHEVIADYIINNVVR